MVVVVVAGLVEVRFEVVIVVVMVVSSTAVVDVNADSVVDLESSHS